MTTEALTEKYRQLMESDGGLDKSDLKVVITLEPLWDQANAISWPGGVAPEDIHATLCLLNEDQYGMINLEAVRTTLQNLAYRSGALMGSITGWGRVGPADKPCWVALLSVLGLAEFRSALVAELRQQGVSYATNYDFLPHITVSYGPQPPVDRLEGLLGQPLTFQGVVLRVKEEMEVYPFSSPQFVEADFRTGNGMRRSLSRPGGTVFDPFLHPRNRVGKFRNVANQIRDMRPGAQFDVFGFVKRDALPGITSGRLIRTDTGYVLSVYAGDQMSQYVHDGPMSKDDLAALIGQAEENLDFSHLSPEERRDLGLPIGVRPGQNLTEEGMLKSEAAPPRVDAVVMEQNGGLTATGTDPSNVAGNPDGEHWILATWDPSEFDIYDLDDKAKEYLATRTHAIGYRTEAGGTVQIEYFQDPEAALEKFNLRRNQNGAPPAKLRPNSDLKMGSSVVTADEPKAPDGEGTESGGKPAAVESSSGDTSGADLSEAAKSSVPKDSQGGTPGEADVNSGGTTEPPTSDMENAGETPDGSPATSDAGQDDTTPGPDVQSAPSIESLMPKPDAPEHDPYAGESPDNEVYKALQKYAVANADEKLDTAEGPVYRLTLGFDQHGQDPEQVLGVKFHVEASDHVAGSAWGAICWPNGLCSLYDEPEPLLSAWTRVKKAVEAADEAPTP